MLDSQNILISPQDMNQIKIVAGYPDVPTILLEDEQIKEFCVYPALEEYFRRFPKKLPYQVTIFSELNIPFPDNNTFGVLDVSAVNKYGLAIKQTYSFWNLIMFQRTMGNSQVGSFGTRYGFNGMSSARLSQQQAFDAQLNRLGTYTYRVNRDLKQIECFSSVACDLKVIWAQVSNNFDDVMFEYKRDVITLAQAYLLRHIADSAGFAINTEMAISFEVESIKGKADEKFQQVREKWLQIPTVYVQTFA